MWKVTTFNADVKKSEMIRQQKIKNKKINDKKNKKR